MRAPGARTWFAIYLGKANNLRDRLTDYINGNGAFGPKREDVKYGKLKELYRKGFDFQIR